MSNDRFIIPELVSPADPDATTGQLQARFDTAQDALNTLGNEAALERQILHGIGRLSGEGCEITLGGDGVLRMTNGYFLAGPGVADDDDAYFIGARLVRVNGEAGYIELVGDDAPPLDQPDGVFGYMSAYGDVLWDDTKPPGAFTQNGRWCIGKAVTGASSISSVDADIADIVPGLQYLLALINAGGGGGSGGEGGAVFWELLKRSAVNPQTIAQFVGSEIEARLGGTGTNLLPPEVRDEVMVNALHSLALHQMSVNNAFENVPPHHALVVSPGRGSGDWAYDELTDEALTTMPVNVVDHEFGSVA
jgi:hypothetical protein